jgi:predicted nucleic acid-binding protein
MLLFDASSLLAAVKAGRLDLLVGGRVHWLTLYEVCNALWRESRLLGRLTGEEAVRVMEVVADVVGEMEVLGVRGSEAEVLRVALSTGLTAYDASYVVVAAGEGLTLVTEDLRLRRGAEGHVEVVSVSELPDASEP